MQTGRPRKHKRNINPIVIALYKERIQRRITLKKLTEVTGYGDDVIGSWERGDTTPNLARLIDWAEVLGFEIQLRRKESDTRPNSFIAGSKNFKGARRCLNELRPKSVDCAGAGGPKND